MGQHNIRWRHGLDDSDYAAQSVARDDRCGSLVGRSPAMLRAFDMLQCCAASDATVLIEGETGTGKEGAAEAVHAASARADGPFVVVDCGAVPENLIESEFFGHERGAFTGASMQRIGAFEAAHGGTIFLDEIGELDMALQPRLLRVLEQRTIQRLGARTRRKVDVRIVAATNRDLLGLVQQGRFRSDLYYRLAVLKVWLPPLRERAEDFGPLTQCLLESIGATPAQVKRFTSWPFVERLRHAHWPGNVRQLRNYLERCVALDAPALLEQHASFHEPASLCESGQFMSLSGEREPLDASQELVEPAARARALEAEVDPRLPYADARHRALREFERAYAERLLQLYDGNVARAARGAGMDRGYLHRMLRRHGFR